MGRLSLKENPIGFHLGDPFFDSGQEELLTCCDIIDLIGLQSKSYITITFDKNFLRKVMRSHIHHLREFAKADL